MTYKTLTTKINVYREGDNPIYGESVTEVALEDEASGAFITLTQHPDYKIESAQLIFDFEEIPFIFNAIELLKNQAELENNDSD